MTALDLVRRIRANPKGSDFQDVRHVEEFVVERTKELQDKIVSLEQAIDNLRLKQEFRK